MLNWWTCPRSRINGLMKIQRSTIRCARRSLSQGIAIKENHIVLLKRIKGLSLKKGGDLFMTPPLKSDLCLRPTGINADDIIGKQVGDIVATSRHTAFRIAEPTLGEYATLSPRLVTPIYPSVCNLIVSLLDLNPTVPNAQQRNEKLEIFEAGTGHGALTLHLARAIHGANTAAPEEPSAIEKQWIKKRGTDEEYPEYQDDDREGIDAPGTPSFHRMGVLKAKESAYAQWCETRRAVITTLDRSSAFSHHARRIVRNFRQGLYYPHVDFHIGSIQEYISARLAREQVPFLTHAILDLLKPHEYMDIVAKGLNTNGTLITFTPNITSLLECVEHVKGKTPLWLENVIEVGAGIAHGGREWDIRTVKARPTKLAVGELEIDCESSADAISDPSSEEATQSGALIETYQASRNKLVSICRPKTGTPVTAGGFLGIWRKLPPDV